jgi:uncharacterized protein YfaQ (DUF2300 family)
MMRAAWLLAALLAAPAAAARAPLQLASLRDGQATLLQLDEHGLRVEQALPPELRTPLGSLWKLFVHAYEVDNARAELPYRCGGHSREEVYCCEPGGSIGRERALVRSCGLYFAPHRLGIGAADWRAYWQARQMPEWLQELAALRPETEVPVAELLRALAALPAQDELRRVLLDVVLEARDAAVLTQLGAQWRVKTWSWHRGNDADARIGGFAGWRLDGVPVWAQGEGTSQRVLTEFASALAAVSAGSGVVESSASRHGFDRLTPNGGGERGAAMAGPAAAAATTSTTGPAPGSTSMSVLTASTSAISAQSGHAIAGDCVDVRLFARYPIARIEAQEGLLRGNYRVLFENGNSIEVRSGGEVMLDGERRLFARLSREEYVARVLEREAGAEPLQAARALAVVIRTYLQQNARRGGQCLAIDDSSATQRVAPRPADAAARAAAAFSTDLVLAGAQVHYHRDRAAANTLSWRQAAAQARAGSNWRDLLSATWPRAALARWDDPAQACRPLPAARDWLLARLTGWRPVLDMQAGYAEARDFEVCVLAGGRPHVERAQRRIHVRALANQQDRLDLVHEYLHLAFDAHPNGQDETYVEALARRLLLE